MSSNSDNKDDYGFQHVSNTPVNSNNNVTPPTSSSMSGQQIFIIIISILLGLLWLSMAIVAGYHAYNEYPGIPNWILYIRIYVAALFAPFYLFFVFVKSSFGI